MADPGEALRQDMQEKPTDKLAAVKAHDLDLVAMGVVAPAEADMLAVEVDEAMVGDRRLVGVAPEIAQDLARVRERGFRVDHPVPGPQRGCQAFEAVIAVGRTAMQLALAAGCGEEVQALSPKDLRQGPDGEQEAVARRGEPPFP